MQCDRKPAIWIGLALWLAGSSFSGSQAQTALDQAVRVSALVQMDPAQITLVWPGVEGTVAYQIERKLDGFPNWNTPISLPGTADRFIDAEVSPGQVYEYHVTRKAPDYTGHGYIAAGINVPLAESRGKLVLIVENTHVTALGAELERLQQDLVGDGWTVLRHDVPRMAVSPANPDPSVRAARSNEVAIIKRMIQADYLADPARVRAVLLFGHVPVPYSGASPADHHVDHGGAWPADVFYGDMQGTWTDSSVTTTESADPRNHNVPGDGKFDQGTIPGPVALEIGRVDMANLSALPAPETELLRLYLNKNHNFRHHLISAIPRALVDDNLGTSAGEAPAANGWANFSALVGSEGTGPGHWLTELLTGSYLWAYGCGPGQYTRAGGVVDTWHFLAYDPKAVFTLLFGSYFGDWDSENNLLRAQLTAPSYTLAAAWAGRPNWFLHHMALGQTIGFSTRLTQNNTGLYRGNNHMNEPHVALLGDPTLRMHPVAPPGPLTVSVDDSGGVHLAWASSSDSVLGYHVYRAAFQGGPYERITSFPINDIRFVDPRPSSDRFYMVRAVKLEASASGTYYNPSQGAFGEVPAVIVGSGDSTWAGGAMRTWNVRSAPGGIDTSPQWDQLKLDGVLNLAATPDRPFTVSISSSTSEGTFGPPAYFDREVAYVWPLVTASGGISGFDPSKFKLVTDGFQGDLAGGRFSLALSDNGNAINLIFTPNHPPTAQTAVYQLPWGAPLRISIADLLERFTGDEDGDSRALVQVGASANTPTVQTDANFIIVSVPNNVPTVLTYWVQDRREYRPGDTIRLVSNTISIDPTPTAEGNTALTSYHAIEVEWQSELGKLYQVQSRSSESAAWVNYGDPVAGTGTRLSVFERSREEGKFYRVVELK